jgi:ABC-type branched-subunit amino acid transport system substrate-binding protein
VHENGRQHPPFDSEGLKRLLVSRIDPGGNRLDDAMPTYRMSKHDLADLIAYLKQLERDADPGVEQDRVQVATLLPMQGPQRALGEAMAQVLQAYFREVNERGGIYRRRIELLVVPYGRSEEETLANLRAALEREGVFALVGSYTVGLDVPLLEMIRDRGIPLVGAFTLDPGDAVIDGNAFYLYPGFSDQARALVVQALKEDPAPSSLLIVGPEGGRTDRLVAAMQAEIRGHRGRLADVVQYRNAPLDVTALTARALAHQPQALFFLGSQAELEPLLAALAEHRHLPRVYLLGAMMSRPLYDLPPAFSKHVLVAYPTVPSDISEEGRAEYQGLSARHALPRGHVQGQIAAYASASLLVEGLRGAGRELTRLRMVDVIEGLYAYDTGVTPRLTFGPNRRIGARGAHVMEVDIAARQYRSAGPWVGIE